MILDALSLRLDQNGILDHKPVFRICINQLVDQPHQNAHRLIGFLIAGLFRFAQAETAVLGHTEQWSEVTFTKFRVDALNFGKQHFRIRRVYAWNAFWESREEAQQHSDAGVERLIAGSLRVERGGIHAESIAKLSELQIVQFGENVNVTAAEGNGLPHF